MPIDESIATRLTVLERGLAEREAVIASQQAEIASQQAEIASLRARLAKLEEQLGKNSSNSSKPPSSDGPSTPNKPAKRQKRRGKGRKQGGQPGHEGHHRALVPVDQVDRVVECRPPECGGCGHELGAEDDPTPLRHQVTEIPPVALEVTEYRLHRVACPRCTALTRADLPVGVPERRPLQGPDRYDQFVDISLLGVGAMGRVRRVRDPALNRTMALKTLRPEVMYNPSAVLRFTEEAQTTAQLQHPGILPVFETGRTRDGRLWFTMQEVRGQTLRHVLAEVHAASAEGRWRSSESGWTLQRTIEAFRRVCDAVAYAHSRGVVHRDLKPSNVMVGQHGEVLVVDWGLAKIVGAPDPDVDTDVVVTTRTGNDAQETVSGTIAGTPMYMAPEQARGEIHMIDARTDVYALGAMLYEILAGRGPYQGVDATDVLSQLLAGPPSQLRANVGLDPRTGRETAPMAPFVGLGLPVPEELVDACNRAMERDPADRYPDAGALGADIGAWLDGSRRRERALEVVDEARRALPKADELRHRGRVLRESAARTLDAVPLWAAEEEKAPGWARLDEAARLERKAEKLELDHELLLHGALTHEPHLPEAHQALADRYRANHEAAEDARDAVAAARAENLLRIHAAALPEGSAVRAAHFRYLAGDGLVSLTTDPRGAEVVLYDNVTRNRRIVPGAARTIGFTPLRAVPLPMGSYLAVLRSDGHEPVHYPIHVRREEHVGTIRFGSADAGAIALPRNGELGRNETSMCPLALARSEAIQTRRTLCPVDASGWTRS